MVAPAHPSQLHNFVASARRATLATLDARGRPRLVPICFVVDQDDAGHDVLAHAEDAGASAAPGLRLILYSAIDQKPKRSADPTNLARVRDILARPTAAVLVDRWDEDWARLAWARLDCDAEILPAARDGAAAGRAHAIAALRAKYPQYEAQRLEDRPLIRLRCGVGAWWGNLGIAESGRAGTAAQEDDVQPDVEAM
jgi:PPOX class probable F420-dependent enzyme